MRYVSCRSLFDDGRLRLLLTAERLDEFHREQVDAFCRVARHLQARDRLLWITHWHADQAYFDAARTLLAGIGVAAGRVWVLGNTADETAAARAAGFCAAWVHHNAWLDERILYPRRVSREFRAVLVAQAASYKRPWLAAATAGLVVVESDRFPLTPAADMRDLPTVARFRGLAPHEMADVLSRSHTALVLSEEEGGCYASSESLMCGTAVVSTPSRGGRDVFFDDENSLIVAPEAKAVAAGVTALIARRPDPTRIAARHEALVKRFRERFCDDVLGPLLHEGGSAVDARALLRRMFRHKMNEWLAEEQACRLLLHGAPDS